MYKKNDKVDIKYLKLISLIIWEYVVQATYLNCNKTLSDKQADTDYLHVKTNAVTYALNV